MARKIFIADIVDGTGAALKRAWKAATGHNRLEKRGLRPNENLTPIGFALGSFGGFFGLVVTATVLDEMRMPAMSVGQFLGTWAGLTAGLPVLFNQVASTYRVSKHDQQIYLLERKNKPKESPAKLPDHRMS